jgi:hypothetical protein
LWANFSIFTLDCLKSNTPIQDADIADFKGKFNNLEEAFAHYTSVKIED